MGSTLAMREGGDDAARPGQLTVKQRKFAAAMVTSGGNQTQAAIEAGYQFPAVDGSRLMNNPAVLAYIREGTEAMLSAGGTKAVKWLVQAMDDMALPGATRFAAAKWVAEAAGYGLAVQRAKLDAEAQAQDPSNMTLAQLDELARSLERSLVTLKAEQRAIPGEVVPGRTLPPGLDSDEAPTNQ